MPKPMIPTRIISVSPWHGRLARELYIPKTSAIPRHHPFHIFTIFFMASCVRFSSVSSGGIISAVNVLS